MASELPSELSSASASGFATATIDPSVEQQFNLRIRHPERTSVYDGFAARSAALRGALGQRFQPLRYGEPERCTIDLCRIDSRAPAPLLVFVHGGYWRALDRAIFTFIAEPWLARGVQVALVGYELAPAATVREMVGQVRSAVALLRAQAGALRIDPARWLVSGHSAGAQLGALALQGDDGWAAAGFLGISGVYDIEPLLATTVNRDIRLERGEAQALSPHNLPPSPRTRHVCAVGGQETDGFRDQTRRYAEQLQRAGVAAQALEVPGRTHFDVLDDLADAGGALFQAGWALLNPAAH